MESDKLLLAARRVRRATFTDFIISLAADDFLRASNTHVGKLRQVLLSKFLGTKFTIFDSQSPCDSIIPSTSRSNLRFNFKQVSPRLPACNYSIGAITYELNVLRAQGPRRMHRFLYSIPVSAIQEGGTALTPSAFMQSFDELMTDIISPRLPATLVFSLGSGEPGSVTMASVKNFQLVAALDPSHNISPEEQEKVVLQFGKIGKDFFTIDYGYPLSAFQAFAICLSSFDTEAACQ
ncbi:hypothetical protein Goklo_027602 [Gossypium klotzschianum]|uniref:Tubby C-terminal domain-containing protein n=1 Tax=Gossypium klotzschianum TaxID=34286 RepID=A0A7J8TYL5_9ROSI|nr:hypothetical protein [Gossypium klotzschianum]